MDASLSIIMHQGSPVDAPQYRHSSLFVEFPDATTLLVQIVGASGFFEPEVLPNDNPSSSDTFIKQIHTATIRGSSKTEIQSALERTPISNWDRSWNCQNWVGDALKRLCYRGWITQDQRAVAIDAMVDVVLDAPDED